MPGTKRFICAPYKNQGAQIAKEKLTEIFRLFPLLRREVIGGSVAEVPGNYGKDYVTLRFRNGSEFTVVGAADSTRGGRRHGSEFSSAAANYVLIINEAYLYLEDKAEEV